MVCANVALAMYYRIDFANYAQIYLVSDVIYVIKQTAFIVNKDMSYLYMGMDKYVFPVN